MNGYLTAVLAFVIWGFTSTVILRAVPLTGPAASDAGFLVGSAIMLAVIGPRRWHEVWTLARRHPWRLLGLAAAFAGCSFTYQWSVKSTTVANAVLTHSLQPILTCLMFIPLWGGSPPTRKGYAALALGMTGLGILLWPQLSLDGSLGGHVLGIGLGAISGAFFSWYNVQLPFFKDRVKHDALQTAITLAAAVMLLPVWLFAEVAPFDARGAVATIAFCVLNFAVANMLYFRAAGKIPIGHIATLAYIEPVVGIFGAAMLLGEPAGAGTLVGGTLILASGALVVFDRPHAT